MEVAPSEDRGDWLGHPHILVISDTEQPHRAVQVLLGENGWLIHSSFTCEEALRCIAEWQPAVVLCAEKLPDGLWTDVLEVASELPLSPRLIIFSRLAAEALWSEVLDLGAYDLIGFPFDRQELLRVASFAWQCWQRETRSSPQRMSVGSQADQGHKMAAVS